jgi:HK97 family phage major capsid protein
MEMNPHVTAASRKLAAAKALLERADADARDLTDDEQRSYDAYMSGSKVETQRAGEYRDLMTALEPFTGAPGSHPFQPIKTGTGPAGALEVRSASSPTRTTSAAPREQAIVIPSMAEYRAQAEGTDAAGGYLVPVEQANVVVERLAPESVVLSAEPRLFTMTSDVLRVPKVATGATVAMTLENAAIPDSNLVFDAADLVARKLAGLVRASNEWLNDAVPNGRTVIEQNLLREMAIELDDQFFNGNGTAPNLLGILNWPGVAETPGAATLDDVAAAIAGVEAAFASPNAIFISPENWSALRLERDAGATGGYVLQPDASAATRPVVFGVPVYITPHVGTSIVVADMRHVAVGVRDRVTVHYDPYRFSEYDQSAIRVTSRWAIAPLHIAAVQVITVGALREGRSEQKPTTSGAAKAILDKADAKK